MVESADRVLRLLEAFAPRERDLSLAEIAERHLAVLSGLEAVYVYKVDGPASISMSSPVGGRAPFHATSIGKVLAAWAGRRFEDDRLEELAADVCAAAAQLSRNLGHLDAPVPAAVAV